MAVSISGWSVHWSRFVFLALALIVFCAESTATADEKLPIDLEVLIEPGGPIDGSQRWLRAIQDLPVERLRFRSWQIGDQMKVDERAGHFTVFVILAVDNSIRTSDNQVFRMQDKAALQTWLSEIIDPKKDEQAGGEGSFGLTDKELVQVFDDLSGKTQAKTQGQAVQSVLNAIQQDLRLTIEMSPFADQFIKTADDLEMELQGVALVRHWPPSVTPSRWP
ncbi:MAG: hypothetical protein R3C28_25735 [Pirellulaceae bacterium]